MRKQRVGGVPLEWRTSFFVTFHSPFKALINGRCPSTRHLISFDASLMPRSQVALPEDLVKFLELIRKGRLFALQEWIRSGKSIRFPEARDYRFQSLNVAVETGFHSVVEELLRAGGWSSSELATALEEALSIRRRDLADLFLAHAAPLQDVDFQTVCQTMDLSLMERYLRAGGDPCCNNGFAHALSTIKARPLLRFYRQFRAEFPGLDDQAALSLTKAVEEEKIRWICLLIWAGADPFRPVPWDLESPFPVANDDSTTAAARMMWKANPEILKVMKLNPTAAQARELLDDIGYRPNLELVRKLLTFIPPAEINGTDRNSSKALENLVRQGSHTGFWPGTGQGSQEIEAVTAIELLLDHGARWNPMPGELKYVRRGLLEHDDRYLVQILRLLIYTPGAADLPSLIELCRSQTVLTKVGSADPPLKNELNELRKKSTI